MILVVLSTHVELASATVRGRSYCETGELHQHVACQQAHSEAKYRTN